MDAGPAGPEDGIMAHSTVARFVLLAVLWGSSAPLIKVALQGLMPAPLTLARLVLAAVVLMVIAGLRRVAPPRERVVWLHLTAVAFFGNVLPFLLLSYGERTAGAGVAGVLIGATPLLTLTVAYVALAAERATARKVLGLIIGFAGIVLVVAPWETGGSSLRGEVLCFGTAVSYAINFVYVRKFLSPRRLPALALAAGQMLAAVVLQGLFSPFLSWGTPHLTGRVTLAIVLLGVLSTGLGYVLNFRLIADIGATSASAVNYLAPVVAVGVSVLFLGEGLTWHVVVGGLVVLSGMAYAESRLRTPHRQLA